MKTIVTILLLSSTGLTYSQGKAEKELRQFLIKNKIDTFITIKSGCKSCLISYEKIAKPTDTVTINLLYKKHGQQSLISFCEIDKAEKFNELKIDVLRFVTEKRQVLLLKDKYYREQKLAQFQAPCLTSYPYEKIQIQVGQFNHTHTLVLRETDDCGTFLKYTDWFKVELEILEMFDQLKS